MSALSGTAIAADAMPGDARPRDSVPLGGGWHARLFVAPLAEARKAQPGVDARLSRPVARGMTLSIDVTNLFDRPDPVPANPFTEPARVGRAIGIQLKKTF